MNGIFGVGPLEVVVVLILVLLVFGPERLPELTRNLGSMIRRLRETYLQFVTEFRDELAPIATEIDAATRDLRQDLYAIREAADIARAANEGGFGLVTGRWSGPRPRAESASRSLAPQRPWPPRPLRS